MQVQAYNFFLDGKWTRGVSTESFELRNPATAEVFGRVPRATREDVKEAVLCS
jgi:acyl-CoA reductase-like NAD-dependent aldehyde dehydrogenase